MSMRKTKAGRFRQNGIDNIYFDYNRILGQYFCQNHFLSEKADGGLELLFHLPFAVSADALYIEGNFSLWIPIYNFD